MNAQRHVFQIVGMRHALPTALVLVGALAAASLYHVAARWIAPEPNALVEPAQLVTVARSTTAVADVASASTEKAAANKTAPSATELTRALQVGLRKADCYSGPITGAWTRQSREAMGRFVDTVNARLPFEQPDRILLALIETNPTATCSATRQPAPVAAAPRAEPVVARVEPSVAAPAQVMEVNRESQTERRSDGLPSTTAMAVGAGAITAATVAVAGVERRMPPRLAPYPLVSEPASNARTGPLPSRRATSRSRAAQVYPQRRYYRYAQRRPSRTAFGNVSRSMSRSFNSLKRTFSFYANY